MYPILSFKTRLSPIFNLIIVLETKLMISIYRTKLKILRSFKYLNLLIKLSPFIKLIPIIYLNDLD